MDCSRAVITNHALRRFRQRWIELMPNHRPNGWEGEMRKLLFRSEEARKKSRALQAAIARHGRRARYFVRDDWVFVLNEQANVVITVWHRKRHKARQ